MKVAKESIDAITAAVAQDPSFRGYEISDIEFMLEEILHGHKSCPGNLYWSWGRNMGARGILKFKCDTCSFTKDGRSSRPTRALNKSIVLAALTAGLTFAQVDEFFGIIGIQFMSRKTWFELEEELTPAIDKLLEDVLAENNAIEYALCAPNPDKDGRDIRETTVGYDMIYGQNNKGANAYNGDSGIGITVGFNADLPLHAAVLNKRCTLCDKYENKKEETPEHKCYQNWDNSSSSMEAAVAVMACRSSMKHNLAYTRMVTDSDASIEAALREAEIYAEIDKDIDHLHCCMHINRGVKSKLRNIREEANTKERNVMVPIHRRVITGLYAAIKYNRGQIPIVGMEKAIEGMKHDLMNAFDHCMGHHENCRDYFCNDCDENGKKASIKHTNTYTKYAELIHLEKTLKKLEVLKKECKSWMEGKTTNLNESINATVAKCAADKRVYLCGRGSFERRAKIAVIHRSRGHAWILLILPQLGILVSDHTRAYVRKNDTETAYHQYQRSIKPKHHTRNQQGNSRNADYGKVTSPDEARAEIVKQKGELKMTDDQIDRLLEATESRPIRKYDKGDRIDANHLLKLSDDDNCTERLTLEIVDNKPKQRPKPNATWQSIETHLKQKYDTMKSCGLFIDKKFNFLYCQPDGEAVIQGTRTIILINQGASGFTLNEGKLILNTDGIVYRKAQLQMWITGIQQCLIVYVYNQKVGKMMLPMEATFWEKYEDKFLKFFDGVLEEKLTGVLQTKRMVLGLEKEKNTKKLYKAKTPSTATTSTSTASTPTASTSTASTSENPKSNANKPDQLTASTSENPKSNAKKPNQVTSGSTSTSTSTSEKLKTIKRPCQSSALTSTSKKPKIKSKIQHQAQSSPSSKDT
jgi:hypothetical protein